MPPAALRRRYLHRKLYQHYRRRLQNTHSRARRQNGQTANCEFIVSSYIVDSTLCSGTQPAKNASAQSLRRIIVARMALLSSTISPIRRATKTSSSGCRRSIGELLLASASISPLCRRYAAENVNRLIVGNKCDLADKRAVDTQTAKVYCSLAV